MSLSMAVTGEQDWKLQPPADLQDPAAVFLTAKAIALWGKGAVVDLRIDAGSLCPGQEIFKIHRKTGIVYVTQEAHTGMAEGCQVCLGDIRKLPGSKKRRMDADDAVIQSTQKLIREIHVSFHI